jgi:hypothetical protein
VRKVAHFFCLRAELKKVKQDASEAKAVGSDGKKLAGAAKVSFMKKCEAGA